MFTLDKLQEDYYDSLETDLNVHRAEDYILLVECQRNAAWFWHMSPEAMPQLIKYIDKCLVISGTSVVGYGKTWLDAWEMAKKFGISRREAIEYSPCSMNCIIKFGY